jgi:hypothetical protein
MHTYPPVMWSDPALWRIAVLLAGLLLPPVLGLVGAIRGWKQGRRLPRERKSFSSVVLGIAVLVNWSVFGFYLVTEKIGGLNVNYHIGRFTSVFLILSLSLVVLSIRASSFRLGLLVANFLVLVMWFSIAYAPQHWLERFDFATVKVDDRPVPAKMYIGNPRQSEAETIAIVHVPGVGDYFLDFSEETFREASKHELVALPFGAWTWRRMSHGKFDPPLSFRNVNEYRIPLSGGRVLTVAF